ncbi:GGDEF domain-containing protein [Glycomyces sp. L485]|uniref:GGDEF domain-containing protein n=1 Tax=Glycomyces sp. L485 TaxID=2909235 RepID=UPI001F4A0DE2|nr:GGDEF domain-containing protein [Glycomyces sp. L485]MCH7229452.1 GGDEF domain-containing protein [Glycomyces sp. L485]
MGSGRVAEAVDNATTIAYNAPTAQRRAQAWLFILQGQINQRAIAEIPTTLDQSDSAVRRCRDYRLTGEFHALAAWYHHHHVKSLHFTAQHLVLASRALRSMQEASQAAVDSWYDLAVVMSNCGYQQQSTAALEECHMLAERIGVPRSSVEGVEILVRDALLRYYTGDPHACIGLLRKELRRVKPHLHVLDKRELEWVHYALGRLMLLGFSEQWSVEQMLPETTSSAEALDLRALALASRLIAQGRGNEALETLDTRVIGSETIGVMEPQHLRSLALVAKGDHAESILAAHQTTYALYKQINEFHTIYLDSAAALVDHDQLRRAVAGWADQANTDDLTGLPNRRRLDAFLVEVVGDGMIAVLDLDGFKAVNDTHGHQAGDAILQRVAALLSSVVRSGDLLARTGGDEFILVLPGATEFDADAVSERIRVAVAAENWEYSVPGTPVDVSIGWARLVPGGDPAQTLWAADQAMYQMKRDRKSY